MAGVNVANIVVLIFPIIVLIIAIVNIRLLWKRIPHNEAAVVTGLQKRIISGGGGFVFPVWESYHLVSLESITVNIDVSGIKNSQGVPILMDSVAIVKIKSNHQSIFSAVEHFYKGSPEATSDEIRSQSKYILTGKVHEHLAKMTIEKIQEDRVHFSNEVKESATADLAPLGLEIIAFTVMSIIEC